MMFADDNDNENENGNTEAYEKSLLEEDEAPSTAQKSEGIDLIIK
jgi:hypothetical protein